MFPVQVVNALGQITQVRYDTVTGGLLSSVDPNGLATQYGYDAFGRLLDAASPGVSRTRRYQAVTPPQGGAFDPRSVVRIIESSSTGAHAERDLDAFGAVVRTAQLGLDGKTVQSEIEYDLAGLPFLKSRSHPANDPSQGLIQYSYDARQRLSSVKTPDGATTRYGYASATNCRADICPQPPDTNGAASLPQPADRVLREFNVRGVFSPSDNSLTLTYLDHRDQPVRVVDGRGKQAFYRYGAFGSVLQIIDADDNNTSIQYDKRQRPITLDDPDKATEFYTYTAFDELRSLRSSDAIPHSRILHRDALGRATGITDSVDGDTRFCFDAACDEAPPATTSLSLTNQVGRLVESISPSQIHTRYEFEPPPVTAGQVVGSNRGFLKAIHRTFPKALTNASADEEFTTQYSYNERNLLSQIQYPSSAGSTFAVSYLYDGAGNLQSVFNPAAEPQDPHGIYWTLTDDYEGFAPASEQVGDGTLRTSQYEDLTGRLKHLQTAVPSPTQPPTPLLDLGFTYYLDGLRKTTDRLVHETGEQRSESYYYDAVKRLTTRGTDISSPNSSVSEFELSTYSDSGNITSRTGPGDYTYHPQRKHRVTNAAGVDLTYYDNGDVETRTGAVVGGEQEFEYTGFHLPKRVVVGPQSGPQIVTFEYDASQQRAIKTSPLGQRVYAVDGYERFTPTAAGPHAFAGETLEHIYKVALPNGLMTQVVRGESNGQLVGQTTLYVHPDEQGSPALIRDDSGITHAAPRWDSSGAPDGDATWASTTDPLARTIRTTYTGHEYDEELGLTNMGGRIYDQSVGRFMQPDPFSQAPYSTQGLNRYSYAFNSPLNFVDPSGFEVPVDGGPPEIVFQMPAPKAPTGPAPKPSGTSPGGRRGGENGHGQGTAGGSGGAGGPSGSQSSDATGGDESNRGRPDSPGAPSAGANPNAQAAQAQSGVGRNGDFSRGGPQDRAGARPVDPSAPAGGGGGYSIANPWWDDAITRHPFESWVAVTAGATVAVYTLWYVGLADLAAMAQGSGEAALDAAGDAIASSRGRGAIGGAVSGATSAVTGGKDAKGIMMAAGVGALTGAADPAGSFGLQGGLRAALNSAASNIGGQVSTGHYSLAGPFAAAGARAALHGATGAFAAATPGGAAAFGLVSGLYSGLASRIVGTLTH